MSKYCTLISFLKSCRNLLAALAANIYYRFPARQLKVIGVTGTDGKTTATNLIFQILKSSGKKVGMISTIGADLGGRTKDTGLHITTPSPFALQKMLREMARGGLEYAVLETTSHGLDQHRVWGVHFIVGVLTNVTNEHLDYHQTFERYRLAKAKLFARSNLSVLNKDDPSYDFFSAKARNKLINYSINDQSANFYAKDVSLSVNGLSFVGVDGVGAGLIRTYLMGDYNVSNCLAAIAACRSLGISWEAIEEGIRALPQLPGRFEKISLPGANFTAIVDFAHTPFALEKMLRFARSLVELDSRLTVVFGCAGLRDKQKRPVMGKIACQLADKVIITAEDPRTEDLTSIISQIEQGCIESGGVHGRDYWLEPDRRQAINFALHTARMGDLVVITGKGHEQSMCFGKTEYPWDDRKVVREEWDF